MIISYEKLWILLKKNKMNKKDLAAAVNVTAYTMTKLNINKKTGDVNCLLTGLLIY